MDKSDKIGFKELQKNATRQKLLDVVMEHIYFAAMYEEQSHLSFVVHENRAINKKEERKKFLSFLLREEMKIFRTPFYAYYSSNDSEGNSYLNYNKKRN